MRILHIADLHLGAKNSKLPKEKQDLLKDETLYLCDKLFTQIGANFDVALICGDLFHNKSVPMKIVNSFFKCVQNFSKPVIYISGNHDEKLILPKESIPDNFIILDSSQNKFCYDNFAFYSSEFSGQLNKEMNNILLLHGNIENSQDNDYVDINKHLTHEFDYIALGHIHQVKKYKKGDNIFAYSGSLFSNGFDECGDKGYIDLEIIDKKIKKCEFVPLSQRRYQICECNISDASSNLQILERINKLLLHKGITTNDILRVVLTGYYKEDSDKSIAFLLESLAEYFYVEIEDNSKLKINIDQLKLESLSLKNEFISLVESDDLDQKVKEKIISLGIEALKGEDLSI